MLQKGVLNILRTSCEYTDACGISVIKKIALCLWHVNDKGEIASYSEGGNHRIIEFKILGYH